MVTFYVPDAQAAAIGNIAERLNMSVSEVGTMALSLALLGPESLNGVR
jgi:hypothetical protein